MITYNQEMHEMGRAEAFAAGQQAAINGEREYDNPYQWYDHPCMREVWLEGWKTKALPALPRVKENGFAE